MGSAEPVGDDEIVMRLVRVFELTTDGEGGPRRPSSDAFLQDRADGDVSVWLRSESAPESLVEGYSQAYVCEVGVGFLRGLGLDVKRDSAGGQGHCNITGHKGRGILRKVVRASVWVSGFGPVD